MKHDEIRKYIVLVVALGLLITGVIMLTSNISSQGSIDITTPLLSGKITSGNVGILLIFLSIFLFAITLGKTGSTKSTSEAISKQSGAILKIILMLLGWGLEGVLIYLAIYFNNEGYNFYTIFVMLAMYGGMALIVATVYVFTKILSSN